MKNAQDIATQTQESLPSNPSLLASQRMANLALDERALNLQQPKPTRGRSDWNWIRWTAAGLLAPLAALGGFLIYLETQKGQVVVESEVAEVRVRVVSDGKEVDDVQLSQGANSIRLRAGKYELFIDSPTDSITMTNQAFVVRVLQSLSSTPREKADAMSYLLNPDSMARVRKVAVPAIEKILLAISIDEQLRSADSQWRTLSGNRVGPIALPTTERGKEYDSMFLNADGNIPYSIFMLRFVSAANLSADLAQPLRELAKSCLNSIQPVAPELMTIRIDRI